MSADNIRNADRLSAIVEHNSHDVSGVEHHRVDGDAIANQAFNYGLSIAITEVIAASVDDPQNAALVALVAELRKFQIPL